MKDSLFVQTNDFFYFIIFSYFLNSFFLIWYNVIFSSNFYTLQLSIDTIQIFMSCAAFIVSACLYWMLRLVFINVFYLDLHVCGDGVKEKEILVVKVNYVRKFILITIQSGFLAKLWKYYFKFLSRQNSFSVKLFWCVVKIWCF